MKPGQVITKWWQSLVLGRLRTPQDLMTAVRNEAPDAASGPDRFFGLPDDAAQWVAPERLKAPNFMRTNQFIAQWDRADWQHVDLRLMRWSALFIEYARKRGIPLYVHNAFRTEAQQAELVKRKVSKTDYPRSAHNIGEAVDIIHGVYHWDMTPQEWILLGVLGRLALDRINATLPKAEKLHLNWGGDDGPGDKFRWDPAHWEITDYRARIKRLPVGDPVRWTSRGILARIKW